MAVWEWGCDPASFVSVFVYADSEPFHAAAPACDFMDISADEAIPFSMHFQMRDWMCVNLYMHHDFLCLQIFHHRSTHEPHVSFFNTCLFELVCFVVHDDCVSSVSWNSLHTIHLWKYQCWFPFGAVASFTADKMRYDVSNSRGELRGRVWGGTSFTSCRTAPTLHSTHARFCMLTRGWPHHHNAVQLSRGCRRMRWNFCLPHFP